MYHKYLTMHCNVLVHLPNRLNIWDIFKSSYHASIVRALYSAVVEYMYFCCIARPLQNGLFKVDVPPTGGELFQIDVCCEHTHILKRIKVEYVIHQFICKAKLYTPSTLNINLILWHTQLNVCA